MSVPWLVVERRLATNRDLFMRRLMLRGFFQPLLCSVVLVGQMHAQEVVVPRETKPEAPTETAPSSESEQTPSESATPEKSATPARVKPKQREKKSAAP